MRTLSISEHMGSERAMDISSGVIGLMVTGCVQILQVEHFELHLSVAMITTLVGFLSFIKQCLRICRAFPVSCNFVHPGYPVGVMLAVVSVNVIEHGVNFIQ